MSNVRKLYVLEITTARGYVIGYGVYDAATKEEVTRFMVADYGQTKAHSQAVDFRDLWNDEIYD